LAHLQHKESSGAIVFNAWCSNYPADRQSARYGIDNFNHGSSYEASNEWVEPERRRGVERVGRGFRASNQFDEQRRNTNYCGYVMIIYIKYNICCSYTCAVYDCFIANNFCCIYWSRINIYYIVISIDIIYTPCVFNGRAYSIINEWLILLLCHNILYVYFFFFLSFIGGFSWIILSNPCAYHTAYHIIWNIIAIFLIILNFLCYVIFIYIIPGPL